ncbi:protein NRT1/ PTR FAMILY 5.5 [Daucus carota subsp. sativus]|nr:PREDICTED: protein NRT1/ PTR FAMILY 5.5-like [Daucus carota subsp. sativus]
MLFQLIAGWVNFLEAIIMWVMQTYLTDVWQLGVSHAAGIINVWNGITFFLPIPFAFFADSFLGNFYTLLISCFADAIGLGVLTLSTPRFLGPCKENKPECIGGTQKTLFYFALALIAAGIASRNVSQDQFFKEQQGETTENNKKEEICDCGLGQKLGCFFMVIVIVVSTLVLPFIQSWSVKFGFPAICSLVALLVFLNGQFWHPYQHKGPQGSPLTTFFRVFVAAISKKSMKLPEEKNLYQSDDRAELTRSLRCLNKAAIILPSPSEEEQKLDKWHLCSVREVEDTKVCLRMAPLCITLIVCGFVLSLGNTYFLEQANHLNQTLGRLRVNSIIFFFFSFGASIISTRIYLFAKGWSAKEKKKYFPILGIGLALVTSILCCITAAKVETRRLKVISSKPDLLTDNPSKDTKISMSMFTLVPQYLLLGVFNGISYTCYEELFKTRYPSTMDKYIQYFTTGLTGIGIAASYLSVYIVGKVSENGGSKTNWFKHTLNQCRLDNYYWTLAVISSLNLFCYLIIVALILPEPKPKPKPATRLQKVREMLCTCARCVCKCARCVCVCTRCC